MIGISQYGGRRTLTSLELAAWMKKSELLAFGLTNKVSDKMNNILRTLVTLVNSSTTIVLYIDPWWLLEDNLRTLLVCAMGL